jgi:putative hydrolase of the HAD superfamily
LGIYCRPKPVDGELEFLLEDIELLLFDLDNTLYPFGECWEQANIITFSQSSLTKELLYDDFISIFKKYDRHYWKLHFNKQITLDELRQQRMIQTLKCFGFTVSIEEAQEYFNMFFDNVISLITPNDAINDYLKELKNYYQVGIITNGTVCEQRQKLEGLRLQQIFEDHEIFISEETGVEKPDPRAFLLPLLKYKVEPNHAIYIGDSWEIDVVGSIDAGMNAIWVNSGQDNSRTKHKPLLKVETILSLKENGYLKPYEQKNSSD